MIKKPPFCVNATPWVKADENLWTTGRHQRVFHRFNTRDHGLQTIMSNCGRADNRVIHKFSASSQWALCLAKVFGIIVLFERCRGHPRHRARSSMNAVIR
jgi:hypothetical protein